MRVLTNHFVVLSLSWSQIDVECSPVIKTSRIAICLMRNCQNAILDLLGAILLYLINYAFYKILVLCNNVCVQGIYFKTGYLCLYCNTPWS